MVPPPTITSIRAPEAIDSRVGAGVVVAVAEKCSICHVLGGSSVSCTPSQPPSWSASTIPARSLEKSVQYFRVGSIGIHFIERAIPIPSTTGSDVVETVSFPTARGGEVLVRVAAVEPTYGDVVTRGGRAEQTVTEAGQTFESALGTIRDVAEAVLHQLARLAVPPEEVRVEFGLELNAKAAAVVASASATAQLHVALSWNPPRHRTDQPPQSETTSRSI